MALKGIATFFHQYLGDYFGIISVYSVREALYDKLQALSFTYYDNAKTGDIMSRITQDVEMFRFFVSIGFAELIRTFLLIVFILSVIVYYSIPLAFVTITSMPFLAVVDYEYET